MMCNNDSAKSGRKGDFLDKKEGLMTDEKLWEWNSILISFLGEELYFKYALKLMSRVYFLQI